MEPTELGRFFEPGRPAAEHHSLAVAIDLDVITSPRGAGVLGLTDRTYCSAFFLVSSEMEELVRRNLLFLFSLVLAPLPMHADQVIQANGAGSFNCFQAYPREGFGDDLRVSMSGSDRQGNYMSAQVDVGKLGGLPTCTATLPSLGYDASVFGLHGGSGSVDYNGTHYDTYSPYGSGGCSSGDPNVRCDITFSSSGSGGKGSIDVVLSYWTLIFDDQGNIIDESPTTRVDLGGNVNFYSLGVGEQLGFGDFLYPYSYGSFTMGDAPEPAAWSLMLCATPLAFVYMRRKKRA